MDMPCHGVEGGLGSRVMRIYAGLTGWRVADTHHSYSRFELQEL